MTTSSAGQARLPKNIFDPIQETLVFVIADRRRLKVLLRKRFGKLLEQLLLIFCQLLRRRHFHRDHQIAASAPGDVWHPLAADPERRSGLRPRWDRERLPAIEGGDEDFAAERERREVDRDLAVEIVAVTLTERVFLNVNHDVEIAGWAAAGACLAFRRQAKTLAGRDARRDPHAELLFLLNPAGAATGLTRLRDDRARTTTLPARSRDREESLLISKLAASMALRTGRRRRTGRRATSSAGFTGLLPWNLDRRFRALGRLLERDLEVVAQVRTTLRPASSPASGAEDIAKAEDVSEPAEDVLEPGEGARIETAGCSAAETGVPEAVVHVPLVGIDEDRVGLSRFLEAFFRSRIAGIAIGMELERELAVRALDLLVGRRAGDAEHFVIISFGHAGFATLTIEARSRRSPSR